MAVRQSITKEHPERGFDFSESNLVLIFAVAVGVGMLVWSQPSVPKKDPQAQLLAIAEPPVDQRFMDVAVNRNEQQAVLGAVTYNKDLVSKFSNIPVKTVNDNSVDAILKYTQQVEIVENSNGLNDLIVPDLNNQKLNQRRLKFIEDLKQIAAPSEIADYHRLLIAYYSVNFADTGKDAESVNKALDQIESQLGIIRIGVLGNTGISLP
jgi:hypothetical protein